MFKLTSLSWIDSVSRIPGLNITTGSLHFSQKPLQYTCTALATCVNYADLNNSMLHMRGHVSAGFFRCNVLFLQGKHNGFRHIVARA